jgi:integrase
VPNKTARSSNSKPVNVPLHPALRGMLAAIPTEDRRDYVLPNTVALYLRNAPELSGKIQAHFQSSGVRTTQPGTGVETVTGTDGKPEERHTGKRAVVEVGFHSLRHSFVSLCRESNAPLSVVESIVGHSNPAMTRHYTHTSEAAAISAVAALPSLMGTPPPAALPAADPVAVLKATVRALAESMTAKTWKEARTELLALATKE